MTYLALGQNPSFKKSNSREQFTGQVIYFSECGGLITEPLGQLSFKRGQKVTESQCQWSIGDFSNENGKHVVLVPDKDMYTGCRYEVYLVAVAATP